MAAKKHPYRKIAGKPFSLFFVNQLWKGADHLLIVETALAQERYKRFYFSDIQAIILQRTDVHTVWSFIWGGLAVLFGIIALAVDGTPYVSATLLAVSLLLLTINLAKGPSCSVYLQTAVQIKRIKAFYRLKKARKILDDLKKAIESHQGVLNADSLSEKPWTANFNRMAAPSKPAVPHVSSPKVSAEPFRPLLHQLLFGTMLLAGGCKAIQSVLRWMPLAVLDTLLIVAAFILVIMALVRWHGQLKGSWPARLTWIVLILVVLQGVGSYIWYLVAFIQDPEVAQNHWLLMQNSLQLQMNQHPAAAAALIALAVVTLAVGAAGLKTLPKPSVC